MKRAVVTFITETNKILFPPVVDFAGTDFICFTDLPIRSDYWKIRPVNGASEDYVKDNIREYLTGYDEILTVENDDIISVDNDGKMAVVSQPDISDYIDKDYLEEVKRITEEWQNNEENRGDFVKECIKDGKYNGYPLKLSIGLLIGKKSPDIDKCLSGIQKIINTVEDSELIVVDTGNEDGSIEKALNIGAKIVKFPWIHNFAAARNEAIKAASGSWFMSIDDDEWFDNVDGFVSFFEGENPLCESYDYAMYTVRNYTDEEGISYEDAGLVRLARMRPDLKYNKRIHENFNFPENEEIDPYAINAFAHHYGYVNSLKNRAEKSRRNLALLVLTMNEEPGDWHTLIQIIQELHADKRYDLAYPYVLRGLALERMNEGFHKSLFVVALLKTLAELDRKAIWKYEKLHIASADLNYIEAAYVSYHMSVCAYEEGAPAKDRRLFDKALKYIDSFEQAYINYTNSSHGMQILQSATICENLCGNALYYTDLLIIRAMIYGARKDIRKAKDTLSKINPDNLNGYVFEYYRELIGQDMGTVEFLQKNKASAGIWPLLVQALIDNPGQCLSLLKSITTRECDYILGEAEKYVNDGNRDTLGAIIEGLAILRLVYEYMGLKQLNQAVNALKIVVSRQDNIGNAARILLEEIKASLKQNK